MKGSALPRDHYLGPAVYRWVLRPREDKERFLVGETEDLHRRLREYLEHASKHHQGIRKAFDQCTQTGGVVALEILEFQPFKMNQIEFSRNKLGDPFVRLVLENLCCACLQSQGFDLLNETQDKQVVKKLVNLEKKEPGSIAEFLKRHHDSSANSVPTKS
jgi:hypothetical protein